MNETEAMVEIHEIFGGVILKNRLKEMGVRTHGLNAKNLERCNLKIGVRQRVRDDMVEWIMSYDDRVLVEFMAVQVDQGVVELTSRISGETEYEKTATYLRKIGIHADGVMSFQTWPESGYPVERYEYSLANFVALGDDEAGETENQMLFMPREI